MARVCKDIVCRYKTMTRAPRDPQGGLGHARAPRRDRGREGARDRATRNRSKRTASPTSTRSAARACSSTRRNGPSSRSGSATGSTSSIPYVTYTNDYIETVWWILKRFWEKGLLYEGHKIVPVLPAVRDVALEPRGEPRLQGRRRPVDLRQVQERRDATTSSSCGRRRRGRSSRTPRSPSGRSYDYVRVSHKGETLILAEALLGVLEGPVRGPRALQGSRRSSGRGTSRSSISSRDAENGFSVVGRRLRESRGRHRHRAHRPRLRRGRLPAPSRARACRSSSR